MNEGMRAWHTTGLYAKPSRLPLFSMQTLSFSAFPLLFPYFFRRGSQSGLSCAFHPFHVSYDSKQSNISEHMCLILRISLIAGQDTEGELRLRYICPQRPVVWNSNWCAWEGKPTVEFCFLQLSYIMFLPFFFLQDNLVIKAAAWSIFRQRKWSPWQQEARNAGNLSAGTCGADSHPGRFSL